MRKFLFFLIIFLTEKQIAQAQSVERRDMVWHMGDGDNLPEFGGLTQLQFDLNSNDLKIDTGVLPLKFHTTYSSVCDTSGKLLLYTNGVSIANGNHEIIEGGDSLNLHWQELIGYSSLDKSLAQGALFLPNPANNGIYYLFHEEFRFLYDWSLGLNQFRIGKIYLTTIDMNANEGAGKVIERNKVIVERDSLMDKGRILAVRHANGRDWWVVIPQHQSAHMSKFLVTSEGVLPQPDIVLEQFIYPAGDPEQAAFSPDGSRYAISCGNIATQKRYFYLFDFDRCNGVLYNMQTIQPESPWLWGVFFSPDSRYLYWTHNDQADVTQFDLTDPNWYENGELVYIWDGLFLPFPVAPVYGWNAPDGRIYMSSGNEVKVIHRINRPNRSGAACDFQRNIELPTLNCFTLPNFPNYRLGPLDGSNCDTLGINNDPVAWWRYENLPNAPLQREFRDLSYHEPVTWFWDFGDGTTSQDTNALHIFPYADTFNVCLTVTNINGSSTHCKSLLIGQISGVESEFERENGVIRVWPNPANSSVNFMLQTPDQFEGTINIVDVNGTLVMTRQVTTNQQFAIPTDTWHSGMYWVVLKDRNGALKQTSRFIIQH